jgi:putative hydrolase of the HAD superfamily
VADITLILCDVGGVLGTNGWDHVSRADAAKHFGFSFDEFEKRHEEAVDTWETGHMSIDEYLDFTLFYESRPFSREAVVQFMHDQSRPFDDTIALMRSIAQLDRYTMFTMNNESAELHEYRVRKFGLEPIFSAYLTSCYIAARKPHAEFYHRATAIAHAHLDSAVFIDDRPENLAPMRERGFHTIQAHGVESICDGLRALGVTVPTV